jgi:putative DNA methylase
MHQDTKRDQRILLYKRNSDETADISKTFIEETFPIKEVSIQSAKEKYIRYGNISTLHIWWARRPLDSSRATAYAALIPYPHKDNIIGWQERRHFIFELSKWENSLNRNIL